MDSQERKQVRLILEHLGCETLRKTEVAQKALHADHSASRILRSGATVTRAVEIIEEQAARYVEQAIDQVSGVAKDTDAFRIITASLTSLFRGFEPHVGSAVRIATRGMVDRAVSVQTAADKLFVQAHDRIFKQLEIHRFSFVQPTRGDLAALGVRVVPISSSQPQEPAKRNNGGKPLAPHWDRMWAAIAVKLWTGELTPRSQADVKSAMSDWFSESEIDIGDTALTQRARQLWQAMQAADS